MELDIFFHPIVIAEIPVFARADLFGQHFDGARDIPDDIELGKIHLVHGRGEIIDMNNFRPARLHEKGGFFDDIVPDVDDEVGAADGPVEVVVIREGGGADKFRVPLVDHAFAHLGIEKGNARFIDKGAEGAAGAVAVGGGADEEQGHFRRVDHLRRLGDGLGVRARAAAPEDLEDGGVGLLGGDVLGQFEMDGARALLLGDADRLADQDGHVVAVHDLLGELGEGAHHLDDIDDLEAALLGFLDRLLAGDHQDRHGAELGIGGGRDEVGRPRPEGGNAHAHFSGQAPVGRRHEPGPLLVAREDQLDARLSQRFENVEVFLARNPEYIFDPFLLQGPHEQIGCLHAFSP